ncbi:NUDIX hydrolase [Salininema proteolyticum]|uniref:NUDIX hydrolase n=1 Tax=Salininema proteolyticum TaxID=1607685 RepID=A0ABV8TV30_9ACTN
MIPNVHIKAIASMYLNRHPDEEDQLRPLFDALAESDPVATRERLAGHVTASAFVVDSGNRVLHIEHKGLGKLLQPGGHTEPEDETLIGAAKREVAEETGIKSVDTIGGGDLPMRIDVHRIPHSDSKGEPEHWHADFQFALRRTDTEAVMLQEEEVSGHRWIPVQDLATEMVRDRLHVLLKN